MDLNALEKAVAIVLWADEKIDPDEMETAKKLYEKYNFSWSEHKESLEERIESLLDVDDEEDEEESEEELSLGVLDFGEGVDTMEIMINLAELACADKKVTFSEVDLIHRLGEAMNIEPEIVSGALLVAVTRSTSTIEIE